MKKLFFFSFLNLIVTMANIATGQTTSLNWPSDLDFGIIYDDNRPGSSDETTPCFVEFKPYVDQVVSPGDKLVYNLVSSNSFTNVPYTFNGYNVVDISYWYNGSRLSQRSAISPGVGSLVLPYSFNVGTSYATNYNFSFPNLNNTVALTNALLKTYLPPGSVIRVRMDISFNSGSSSAYKEFDFTVPAYNIVVNEIATATDPGACQVGLTSCTGAASATTIWDYGFFDRCSRFCANSTSSIASQVITPITTGSNYSYNYSHLTNDYTNQLIFYNKQYLKSTGCFSSKGLYIAAPPLDPGCVPDLTLNETGCNNKYDIIVKMPENCGLDLSQCHVFLKKNVPNAPPPVEISNGLVNLSTAKTFGVLLGGLRCSSGFTVIIYNSDASCLLAKKAFAICPKLPIVLNVKTLNYLCSSGPAYASTAACPGLATGGIGLYCLNSASDYTYEWTNSSGTVVATSQNLSNVIAGTYNLKLTVNATGCYRIYSLVVPTISVSINITADAQQVCDGSINVTANATVSPDRGQILYYLWSDLAGSTTSGITVPASSSPLGTYTVTVTEGSCSATASKIVDLNHFNTDFSISSSVINPTCAVGSVGSVEVQVEGGEGPYSYNFAQTTAGALTTGLAGNTANGLTAGSYTVTVTDANGCVRSRSFEIEEATSFTLTTPEIDGCDISIVLSGGTGPYTFTWDLLQHNDPYVQGGTTLYHHEFINRRYTYGAGDIANTLHNAQQGNYKVYATDANGCISNIIDPVFNVDATIRDFTMFFRWRKDMPPAEVPSDAVEIKQMDPFKLEATELARNITNEVGACLADAEQEASALNYKKRCLDPSLIQDLLEVDFNINYYHYTLYYYDRVGNLVRTIPPRGVEYYQAHNTIPSDRTLHPFYPEPTNYEYNSLGQLVKQQTPDGGVTNFIYDNLGRVWFSQNAKQYASEPKLYSYTRYDDLGRITEVGQAKFSPSGSPSATVIEAGAGPGLYALTSFESLKQYALAGAYYNPLNKEQVTYTVYTEPGNISYYGTEQHYLLNRVSYSFVDEDGDNTTAYDRNYTYYSYDPHGNVEWLVQDLGGFTRNFIRYEYDLISNKVLKVKYNELGKDKFFHRYEYDEDNRLLAAYTSDDDVVWDKDGSYKYYLHGPLQRTEIGQDKLQGIDYYYTLQGWLKGINNYDINSTSKDPGKDNGSGPNSLFQKDIFGMTLGYFNGDFIFNNSSYASFNSSITASFPTNSNSLYNGNIATWAHGQKKGSSDPDVLTMDDVTISSYRYDRLNRIRNSDFEKFNSSDFVAPSAGANTFKTSYSYDANGNITNLIRYDGAAVKVDDLDYTYKYNPAGDVATNQLTHVADNGTSGVTDIQDNSSNPNDYTYDEIGNLISDASNGIGGPETIKWNVYGKIESISIPTTAIEPGIDGIPHVVAAEKRIEFSYDAGGNRVVKKVKNNVNNPTSWVYTYYVRDASGNVMGVYDRTHSAVSGSVYKASYKLSEQPIYGSSRLGSRAELQTIVGEIASVNMDQADLDKLNIPSSALNSASATLFNFRLFNRSVSTNNPTVDNLAISLGTYTSTPINSLRPITFGSHIAVAENDKGEQKIYGYIVKESNQKQAIFYSNFIQLSQVTSSGLLAAADIDSRGIFVEKPGANDDFYYFVRSSSGAIKYFPFIKTTPGSQQPYNINNGLTLSGNINNGRALAVLERRNEGDFFLFTSKILPVTGGSKKKEIWAYKFVPGNDVPVSSVLIYTISNTGDVLGEGQMKLSSDGRTLFITDFEPGRTITLPPWATGHGNISQIVTSGASERIVKLDLSTTFLSVLSGNAVAISGVSNLKSAIQQNAGVNSMEVAEDGSFIVFNHNQTRPSGSAIKLYDFRNNQQSDLITGQTGNLQRGSDGGIYFYPNKLNGISGSSLMVYKIDRNAAGIVSSTLISGGPTIRSQSGILPLTPVRLGVAQPTDYSATRFVGTKNYEISDHLGNVRTTFSDKLFTSVTDNSHSISITSHQDYYPFGSVMPGRSYSTPSYRYGFNGKEKDDEVKGSGNSLNFGDRIYDSRLGKWLSVDLASKNAPSWTPYRYGFDNPLRYRDLDGNWESDGHFWTVYYISLSMGMKIETAFSLAQSAEYYDHFVHRDFKMDLTPLRGKAFNAAVGLGTWADPKLQGDWHGLTGGPQKDVLNNAINRVLAGELFQLHKIGDAFAHSYDQNGERVMWGDHKIFGFTIEHAFAYWNGGNHADEINSRRETYFEYVKTLIDLFNNQGFKYNSEITNSNPDLSALHFMQKNGHDADENMFMIKSFAEINYGDKKSFTDLSQRQYDLLSGYLDQSGVDYNCSTNTTTIVGSGSNVGGNITEIKSYTIELNKK